MPSTYSSNLKLELMATGENSGTWGNITNTNLGTAVEQAIIGLGNVDYVSDANLTISITNSNAAQAARALVLNVTSSLSLTNTRELVVPTIEKQYIVQNNTTGSQSITVKTSAGTGITVPNGRKAHLYVDGTNVIQMFDFVDINGGTIDGTAIGGSSAAAGSFTTLGASGAATFNGAVTLGDAAADLIVFNGTVNSHLLFTDNTYDIGASGATRPRNLFLAGAATIGGNLSVGGTLTLTGGLILNGNVTVGDSSADTLTVNATITSNLLFTDNTYDIGASGATRPRNLFLAGNATIGGNTTMTGSLTVDSTTDSSSTTTGSIQTDGGVGIAKALYVGTTLTVDGNTTLGNASTDTVQVNGYMGVGGAGATNVGIYAKNSALAATTQVGVQAEIVATSAATSNVRSFASFPSTAAAAFTTANMSGVYLGNATKGAGSTITNLHGLYITDQTQGTNNYGITSLVSSGTDKWNIYASGTAANYFAGNVLLGTTTAYSWANNFNPVLRLGSGGYVAGRTPGANYDEIYVGTNAYNDGTWKYGVDGFALQYYQDSGQHVFRNAASGLAGNAVTFIERFAINQSEAVFNDPGNDYDFRVESDNSTHMLFVDASQDAVLINTNTSVGVASGAVGKQQIATTGATIHLSLANYNAVDTDGGILAFGKSRGATVGSYTVVQNGDTLGEIRFAGADGTDLQTNGAVIRAQVDGTPGGNDMPSRLVFLTTADGSATPAEVARITSDKYVRLASGTGGIQFNGDTAAANALDDYEEGDWTPVFQGGTTAGTYTYNTQSGRYIKVGKQVTVWCTLVDITASSAGTGDMYVSGLPFTVLNSTVNDRAPCGATRVRQVATALGSMPTVGGSKGNAYAFFLIPSGTTDTALTIATYFANSMDIGFTLTYETA
jgi:hypothetical protein